MDRPFSFSQDDLTILYMALSSYMDDLQNRKKRADYYFRSHSVEKYKQVAEKNRVLIDCRMKHVQDLMDMFLLEISPA